MGLLTILMFNLKVSTLSWDYGAVESQFPVMEIPFDPQSYARAHISPLGKINKNTAAVILTPENFYFGSLDSFTEKFHKINNKYIVPHNDGKPQIDELLSTIKKWNIRQHAKTKSDAKNLLVLLPSKEIPVPIIIQTMHWIKKSNMFAQVILASEMR